MSIIRMRPAAAAILIAGILSGCAYYDDDPMAMKGEPYKAYMVGPPYEINGRWYHPKEDFNYDRTGIASWYGRNFDGRRTANGETYDMNLMTAAHPTLPMPTMVSVSNLENGRNVVVRINDRGPFHNGRIIDLSRRAAERLGLKRDGIGRVRVQVLKTASLRLKREALAEMAQTEEGEHRRQVAEQYRAAMSPKSEAPHTAARAQAAEARPAVATTPKVRSMPLARAAARHKPEGARRRVRRAEQRPDRPNRTTPDVRSAALGPDVNPEALARISPGAGPSSVGRPIDIRPQSSRATEPDRRSTREPEKRYFIQVGSYSERSNAMRTGQRLEKVALTRIAARKMDDQTFYRVRVGPFASRSDVRPMLAKIRRAGYSDARIVVE